MDKTFSECVLEDFENEEFRKIYLKHHEAEIDRPGEHDPLDSYGFGWRHGYMTCFIKSSHHIKYAELWECIFIYLWYYKGVYVSDAGSFASRYVQTEIRHDKEKK